MRRLRTTLALVATLAIAFTGPISAAGGPQRGVEATSTSASFDQAYALVQLNGEPLSTYVQTKPGPGKKIDFDKGTTKSYRAQLSALRNDFKQWLRSNAPMAQITGSWDISVNAVGVKLNGASLDALRAAPQVKSAEYQAVYHPTAEDPDLGLINAQAAWSQVGGAAYAGSGIKVGIIDSGIDIDHPCFSDAGYPAQVQLGDHRYTNNKVIVAKVFNNQLNKNHFDAKGVGAHGTHVAGTVACNYQTPAEFNGVSIPYAPSGVAPRALLGNYNVFPGDVEGARSEDILNALEAAYADGMDVVNMSLGGGASGKQDLVTIAVDDLDIANMVVAVSAGNEGDGDPEAHPPLAPGHYTVGSPGSAARALTAGASSVGHHVTSDVQQDGNAYASLSGEFAVPTVDLTAATVVADGGSPEPKVDGLINGCTDYAGPVTGKIVLVARGTCDFSLKVHLAQVAGAVGVIVVNRDPDPIPMADDPAVGNTIPAVMVGKADGLAMVGKVPMAATITAPFYELTGDDNIQAYFSSQGPTDVDFRVKPDLMAPGMNVLSSVPGDCGNLGCWDFFDGTSMASPHLAGAAAVVRGAHHDWTAEQVRSAIVNTATQGVVTSFVNDTVVTDANVVGAGLLNVDAAVAAQAAIGPVSTSFGAVPGGSGQTRSAQVSITNLTSGSVEWSVAVDGISGDGVSFAVNTDSVKLAAGATTTVTVTMSAEKGAAFGDHQAWLRVGDNGGAVAHSALYVFIK